jgi:hypothetical protein
MGADAKLFLFDYAIYRESIVPAFLRLMSDGAMEDWLRELIHTHGDDLGISGRGSPASGFVPIGFWECCTYLDSELAVTKVFAKREREYDGSWENRACRHPACAVRDSCPFHFGQGEQLNVAADDWMRWLESAVVERSLGNGIFLGRSIDCYFYWDLLDRLGVDFAHPIRLLLERLGRRGFVVGYRGSLGTEGIHGWLGPAEATTLADHLFALQLPDYEYSFATMGAFKRERNILEGRVTRIEFQWPVYEHPRASFEELSLSYVRTVCSLAAREGKGVLWGNDVA